MAADKNRIAMETSGVFLIPWTSIEKVAIEKKKRAMTASNQSTRERKISLAYQHTHTLLVPSVSDLRTRSDGDTTQNADRSRSAPARSSRVSGLTLERMFGGAGEWRRIFESDRKVLAELAKVKKQLKDRPVMDHTEETGPSGEYFPHVSTRSQGRGCPAKQSTAVLKRFLRLNHRNEHQLTKEKDSSSSSPINPFSTTDLVNSYDKQRGVSNSNGSQPIDAKPAGRVTGQTQHHHRMYKRVERGRNTNTQDDLPSVVSPDDDKDYLNCALTTTQRTPGQSQLSQIQPSPRKTHRGSYRLSSWPYNQNNTGDLGVGPLSISGIRQDGRAGDNSSSSDEDPSPQSSNPQIKITEDNIVSGRPPVPLKTHQTDSAQSSQSNSNNSNKSIAKSQRQRSVRTQNGSPSGRNGVKRQDDPHESMVKYEDPIAGSSSTFQNRLAEIANLEQETVRWERLKKIKKKSRDD